MSEEQEQPNEPFPSQPPVPCVTGDAVGVPSSEIGDERTMIPNLFGWGLLFECGLGVLALVLAWLMGRPLAADLHWDPLDLLLGVIASLPMLLLFAACVRWPIGPLARIQRLTEEFLQPLFASCTVFELFLLSAAAGVSEELLFRGLLQGALADRFGTTLALASASLFFGLAHAITPTYFVLAGGMGCYLGMVWLASDNLLSVVVAHGLYDFLALVFLVRKSAPREDG